MIVVHDCHSAADAIAAARRAQEWRRTIWGKRCLEAPPEPIPVAPPPLPKDVVAQLARVITCKQRIEAIVAAAAEHYSIEVGDIHGDSRRKTIVHARHVAMFLVRTTTTLSLPRIGRSFDRDHTTVLHGVRAVENSLKLQEAAVRIAAAALASLSSEKEGDHGD
jgi:hypothetical protein